MICAAVQQRSIDEVHPVVAVRTRDSRRHIGLESAQRVRDRLLALSRSRWRHRPCSAGSGAGRRHSSQVHLEEPEPSSVQSANVRLLIWRFISVPALVVPMRRRARSARVTARARDRRWRRSCARHVPGPRWGIRAGDAAAASDAAAWRETAGTSRVARTAPNPEVQRGRRTEMSRMVHTARACSFL
jgi:hypothetical protein